MIIIIRIIIPLSACVRFLGCPSLLEPADMTRILSLPDADTRVSRHRVNTVG
ncbi:hypothetical protein JOB18_002581 [Solea senegalensis]|uniref:Uncharacterized protein n=1 Tax=Solea senegalensis TaxID=28829 RepID=A0AAV6RRJ0_SOLSE|nr:hypothetical protein JOB18_002581 [Solea senegalensis]